MLHSLVGNAFWKEKRRQYASPTNDSTEVACLDVYNQRRGKYVYNSTFTTVLHASHDFLLGFCNAILICNLSV